MANPLRQDLEHILAITTDLWQEFRDQRILITGGTGFFGCWLLESFIWANEQLKLNASTWVLTRNPEKFKQKFPHLAFNPAIKLYQGDVQSFGFPTGEFSHIIHGATEASALAHQADPLGVISTTVEGTKHILEFARSCGVKKLLLTSSGAVYGQQPGELTHISEDYLGGPDPLNPRSAYGEGKRLSELLSVLYGQQYGFEVKIARCFAFVGPYQALDGPFAIANFIKNVLDSEPIHIKGDGTPYRSYLYAADLAIWLWTILASGKSFESYNVGSGEEISVKNTALSVAGVSRQSIPVIIDQEPIAGNPPSRYVPSVQKAKNQLGLTQTIDLLDAIDKTLAWHLY